MPDNVTSFRDGIFALRTRRFGTIAELMIERLYGFTKSHNQYHDRFDEANGERIEIKFSTATRSHKSVINKDNAISQCIDANPQLSVLCSYEIDNIPFDCNIQQVKTNEFDELYYGLFFKDRIAIFKMTASEVVNCPGFSNKQHRGNLGEGQFHLNQSTIGWHLQNHLKQWVTYTELYDLFESLQ